MESVGYVMTRLDWINIAGIVAAIILSAVTLLHRVAVGAYGEDWAYVVIAVSTIVLASAFLGYYLATVRR